MLGKRLSRRPLAFEGFDCGRGRRAFRGQLVLGRVGLGVLQLHFQLIDESLLALRARAIERAPQLFDLQTQPRDQRLGAGGGCLRVNHIGRSACRTLFALKPRGPLGEDQRMGRGEIVRERIKRVWHIQRES